MRKEPGILCLMVLFTLLYPEMIGGAPLEDAETDRNPKFISTFFDLMDTFIPSFNQKSESGTQADFLRWQPSEEPAQKEMEQTFFHRSLQEEDFIQHGQRKSVYTEELPESLVFGVRNNAKITSLDSDKGATRTEDTHAYRSDSMVPGRARRRPIRLRRKNKDNIEKKESEMQDQLEAESRQSSEENEAYANQYREWLDQKAMEDTRTKNVMKNPVKDAFNQLNFWRNQLKSNKLKGYKVEKKSVEEVAEEEEIKEDEDYPLWKDPVNWKPVKISKGKFSEQPNIYTVSESKQKRKKTVYAKNNNSKRRRKFKRRPSDELLRLEAEKSKTEGQENLLNEEEQVYKSKMKIMEPVVTVAPIQVYKSKMEIMAKPVDDNVPREEPNVYHSSMTFIAPGTESELEKEESANLDPASRVNFEDDFEIFKNDFENDMLKMEEETVDNQTEKDVSAPVLFIDDRLPSLANPTAIDSTNNANIPLGSESPMKLIPIEVNADSMTGDIFPMIPINKMRIKIKKPYSAPPVANSPKEEEQVLPMKLIPFDMESSDLRGEIFPMIPLQVAGEEKAQEESVAPVAEESFPMKLVPFMNLGMPGLSNEDGIFPMVPLPPQSTETEVKVDFMPELKKILPTADEEKTPQPSSEVGQNREVPVINIENFNTLTPDSLEEEIKDAFEHNQENFPRQQIPDAFKTNSFMDGFKNVAEGMFEAESGDAIAASEAAEDDAIPIPEEMALTESEMTLLNKMIVSDTMTETELDEVRGILADKMTAMKKLMEKEDKSAPEGSQVLSQSAQFQTSGGEVASFPIVLQIPKEDCPKYCINIKVEVTRTGRSLSTNCRQTGLCSSHSRRRY